MNNQDGTNNNNDVFQFPSELKIKEESQKDVNQKRGEERLQLLQPHTQSSLPSVEQLETIPGPQLIQIFSELSIDEQQHQLRKQMSIEDVSPSPMKKQKVKVDQNQIEMKQVEQVEEIPHIQTRRKANKTNYNVDDSPTEEDDFKACHCSKTHCLQLYCSCFHNRRPCTNECKCNDCFNDGKHEDEVIKAVEQIKLKEQRASHHDLDSFDTKQVWGCKCKKTKCVKGYCECFIRGKKCTSHCQCTECENKRQPKQHKYSPFAFLITIKTSRGNNQINQEKKIFMIIFLKSSVYHVIHSKSCESHDVIFLFKIETKISYFQWLAFLSSQHNQKNLNSIEQKFVLYHQQFQLFYSNESLIPSLIEHSELKSKNPQTFSDSYLSQELDNLRSLFFIVSTIQFEFLTIFFIDFVDSTNLAHEFLVDTYSI